MKKIILLSLTIVFAMMVNAQVKVPENLKGNWYRSDNAEWEISFLDSVVIYKSQVWNYLNCNKEGLITLKENNGQKNLNLYVQEGSEGAFKIGETATKLIEYTKNRDESAIPKDNDDFKLPLFKPDAAVYCGYVKGFKSGMDVKKFAVYVAEILKGGPRVPFPIKIEKNGYFKIKIPLTNPQLVNTGLPYSNSYIFMEPGKTVFQLLDAGSNNQGILFMGDNARINTEINHAKDIISLNDSEVRKRITDFTPDQYRQYCNSKFKQDSEKLEEYCSKNSICKKAYQLLNLNLNYHYKTLLLGYYFFYTISEKNDIDFIVPQPGKEYYSFLTYDLINNPLAIMMPEFNLFINYLSTSDIVGDSPIVTTVEYEIVEKVIDAGYSLDEEDKKFIAKLGKVATPQFISEQKEFYKMYSKQEEKFNKKYFTYLKNLMRKMKGYGMTATEIEDSLTAKKVQFTSEEKAFLTALKEMQNKPAYIDYVKFKETNKEDITQLRGRHPEALQALLIEKKANAIDNNLKTELGIQPGIANDILISQLFNQLAVRALTPHSDKQIKDYQQRFTNPFFSSYVKVKNDELKAVILANKSKSGSKVNDVPKTKAENLFDSLIAKHKGKVVFVDFWATWCAPCLKGIKRIEPLKEDLANERVAFVYITNQTSPKTSYDNIIQGIKGDHYRMSTAEWNELSLKFKISGIPHYVLVNKDGRIISPKLSSMGNEQLKNLLLKYTKE